MSAAFFMEYFVYLMQCADGTLYTGFTTDLKRREAVHNAGKGAKYTRSRLPVRMAYFETYGTEHEARSREWHLKRLSHAEKVALIAKEEE